MSVSDKKALRNLWSDFFNQLYGTSAYCSVLYSALFARSTVMLGNMTASHNVKILGKYNNYFTPVEKGISYAVVLSFTTLFENGKKKQTLDYLMDEASKFKIDRKKELADLKQKHKEALEQLETARNTFFAHKAKERGMEILIPSSEKLHELLNDTAKLLNSMGKDMVEGGESYSWNEAEPGWSKETERDFQHLLDNLHRGEAARIAEIGIAYNKKIYDSANAS